MNAARTFRDLRVYQLARSARLAARFFKRVRGFLERIDRASDFCKNAPNIDYRVKEEASIWEDFFVGDSDAHGT
jgi:hypothetical protein